MADTLKDYSHFHFIGIGGIGMSAIASAMLNRGYRVTGSDLSATSSVLERLRGEGATIHTGHRAENIDGADLVLTSTAIRADNPERVEAERRGIPIWRRAKALGAVMCDGKGLAVTGTHGKTTTTAMASLALVEAGLDPTALIGGELEAFGGNFRIGKGEWFVAEADESDASFLELDPDLIILTNIEADHMDFYRDMDHLTGTFLEFLGRLREGGRVVACADHPLVLDVVRRSGKPALTYGLFNKDADLTAEEIGISDRTLGAKFTAVHKGVRLGEVHLKIPGLQNIANSLAVILAGISLGCEFEPLARALGEYGGTKRRYQLKGQSQGITVIDDYAHHPTEIKATLSAARSCMTARAGRRIVGVFQPHRYTRTASLAPEFGGAFGEADLVVVTDVYAAGEDPIPGVSGSNIYDSVRATGHPQVYYVPKVADVPDFLRSRLSRGDMVFTMGAGDVWRMGERLLNELHAREQGMAACGEEMIAGVA